MSQDIHQLFKQSFFEANSNISAHVYSSSIRFIAIILVILAVMWSVNHFLTTEEKEAEGFLTRLGSRLTRLIIGMCLFMLILIAKG